MTFSKCHSNSSSMSSSNNVKVFVDLLSQPSRAALLFCKAANIPHELVNTSIKEQAHRTTEYTKLQPLQTVINEHGHSNLRVCRMS